MWLILSSLHVIASLLLISLVLLQQGKGADMGASLGGDSSSLFGPMVENPLKNLTTLVAIVFMTTSVSLAYQAKFHSSSEGRLFSRESQKEEGTKQELPPTDSAAPAVGEVPKTSNP